MQNEINNLIAQHLAGTINAEDREELNRLRKADSKLDKAIRHIEKLDDFARRYAEYSSVDSEAALRRHLERQSKLHTRASFLPIKREMSKGQRGASFNWHAIAASVAVLVVLIIGSVMYFNSVDNQNVAVEQELPQEVIAAMQQSTEKGLNQGTTVALKNIRMDKGGNGIPVNGSKEERIAALLAQLTHTPVDHIDAKMDELLATTTYYDKEFWLKLDDGTLVHINNNTRVIYPEHFGKNKREVIIDGEAYFMVAHDDTRPFIVHTPQGDVRDYGTEFFVSTNQLSTTVALVSGKVSVTPRGGSERMMSPGQEASLTDSGLSIAAQDMTAYKAWNTGTFLFHDQTLENILDVASRWYNVDVRFAEPELRSIRFTGSFDRYDRIAPMLDAICGVTGLKWKIKDGMLEIAPH